MDFVIAFYIKNPGKRESGKYRIKNLLQDRGRDCEKDGDGGRGNKLGTVIGDWDRSGGDG